MEKNISLDLSIENCYNTAEVLKQMGNIPLSGSNSSKIYLLSKDLEKYYEAYQKSQFDIIAKYNVAKLERIPESEMKQEDRTQLTKAYEEFNGIVSQKVNFSMSTDPLDEKTFHGIQLNNIQYQSLQPFIIHTHQKEDHKVTMMLDKGLQTVLRLLGVVVKLTPQPLPYLVQERLTRLEKNFRDKLAQMVDLGQETIQEESLSDKAFEMSIPFMMSETDFHLAKLSANDWRDLQPLITAKSRDKVKKRNPPRVVPKTKPPKKRKK